MTAKQALDNLTDGCSVWWDVQKKMQRMGYKMTHGEYMTESCPIARYLKNKTGKKVIVERIYCYSNIANRYKLPLIITLFISNVSLERI